MLQEAEEAEKQKRILQSKWGNGRNKAFAANDLIVGDCADDCNGTCIFVYEVKGRNSMMSLWRRFYYEETAVGVVEIILILVVLISLVVIFKKAADKHC